MNLGTLTEIEPDSRRFALSFSSETLVEREYGMELLDHSPSSVQLDRVSRAGPLLMDHDPRDQVGVIEEVSVGADRRGQAVVRFGRSARATEIYQDVLDGIRTSISVGYRIHDAVRERNNVVRVTQWEPLEISFVSIPADVSVGVGRAEGGETFSFSIRGEAIMTDEVKQDPAPSMDDIVQQVRAAETERVKRITKIGSAYDARDLALKYAEDGKTVEEFVDALAAHQTARKEELRKMQPSTRLDMEPRQVRQYSLVRALNAALSGSWKGAEFERECSQVISDKIGRESRGFFVPFDVQARGFAQGARTSMVTSTDSAGGYLVGTDHLAGSFIDYLRAKPVVMQAGAQMLDGLVGDIDIPKQTGAGTFYWVAEDGSVTDSALTLGSVTMSPRTVGCAVPISRRLLKQSSPSVEALVQRDLAQGAVLAIDDAALEGTGAGGQPLGLINVTGVNTKSVSSPGSPTWAEIVGFESAVAADNALGGTPVYITTPTVFGNLRTTSKDTGSGLFLASDDGMVAGYRVLRSTQVAASGIYFGDYSQLVIGMWGVLDVMLDTTTNASKGGLVVRVFQDVDVAVRHAEAFCINA